MLLSRFDSASQLITVFLIFILVCLLTYFTTRFIGGYQRGRIKGNNIQVIETFKITQNKFLQIVKIGNRYFVISIGKDTIDLITELKEEDIFIPEIKETQMLNFKDILDKARNMKSKKQADYEEDKNIR